MELLSIHMVQHMTLSMLAPIPLLLGAPATLALRALRPAHPPAAWSVDPMADQSTAGAIAWAFGEIPTLVMLLVMGVRWMRSEEGAARRSDRAADRDGDAELHAYNDYLIQSAGGW